MKRGKRTTLFEIFGETNDFVGLEFLIKKCLNPSRELRPENMMIVKKEESFAEHVERIEEGELPSDIMTPPAQIIKKLREENEQKDLENQRQKEAIEQRDRTIEQLQKRLDTFNEIMEDRLREEAKQKDKEIAMQNQENAQLKHENASLKQEQAKMKKLNSELEENLENSKKIIDKLNMKNKFEKHKNENARREIEKLESHLKEDKEKNRREIENHKFEIERLGHELGKERKKDEPVSKKEENRVEARNEELKKLRKELGAKGGAGEFYGIDKNIRCGGERNGMVEKELRNVLKLLEHGKKTINLKFWRSDNFEVAEGRWHLEFKGTSIFQDWYSLSIWKKEGGRRFKAVAQQICHGIGTEANRREIESEADGERQTIKYKSETGFCWTILSRGDLRQLWSAYEILNGKN